MDNKEFEFAIHPGKILKEDLKAIKMTQRELSKRTGINTTVINELIHGKRNFTINIAKKLSPIFKLPVSYWCNMQTLYNETTTRINDEKVLRSDAILEQTSYTTHSIIKVCSEIYNQAV